MDRRYVRKGEKAITLCQPVTCKRKGETQDDGTTPDDATFTRFIYRPHWFVLSQTDGDDVTLPALPEWTAERALAALEVTRVPFDHVDGNCQGYPSRLQVEKVFGIHGAVAPFTDFVKEAKGTRTAIEPTRSVAAFPASRHDTQRCGAVLFAP